MVISCPRCETQFALADELYVAGKKARCSQCGHVFVLPEQQEDPAGQRNGTVPPGKHKARPRKKKIIIFAVVALMLVCGGLGYGGYMLVSHFLAAPKTTNVVEAALSVEEQAIRQRRQELFENIPLDNVAQYFVENERLGPIVVIQGEAVNRFSVPQDLIVVEARLLDASGKVLKSKVQAAGITLSYFQLKSLAEDDLEKLMSNTYDIIMNNKNVKPGASVPFLVVFPLNPPGLASFDVAPVSSKNSEVAAAKP